MNNPRRRCLTCGNVTTDGSRCTPCHRELKQHHERHRERPPRDRPHYGGNYYRRAKQVRDNASVCWICLEGPLPNDPWTADHLTPGDPDSALLPAHRSCNSRRGNGTNAKPLRHNEKISDTPPDFFLGAERTPRL